MMISVKPSDSPASAPREAWEIDSFLRLVRQRRAARAFSDRPVPEAVIEQLLEAARWAPSSFNLQPTHVVVVTDPGTKRALRHACMDQKKIEQAAAVIVFTGDTKVAESHLDMTTLADLKAGAIDAAYRAYVKKMVGLAFDQGPAKILYAAKVLFVPLLRVFKPVPHLAAVKKRYWITKQVMLPAMTLLLAATAAGLASCPVEGFDEARVRKLLGIPRSHYVPVMVPIGYPVDGSDKTVGTRLPLTRTTHSNRFGTPWLRET